MSAPWLAALLALWAIVILLALIVLGTLRRLVPLLERAEASLGASNHNARRSGLSPGTPVPAFSAQELGRATFTDADLRGSKSIVLFLGSACAACERFVDDLRVGRVPDLGAHLIVVADVAEDAENYRAHGVTVLVQQDRSLARIFERDRVPHAFVVDEDGRVLANSWPNEWERLRALVRQADGGGVRESDFSSEVVAS
jgi:peroxiredoxin